VTGELLCLFAIESLTGAVASESVSMTGLKTDNVICGTFSSDRRNLLGTLLKLPRTRCPARTRFRHRAR
jgi:hypothetical protein